MEQRGNDVDPTADLLARLRQALVAAGYTSDSDPMELADEIVRLRGVLEFYREATAAERIKDAGANARDALGED